MKIYNISRTKCRTRRRGAPAGIDLKFSGRLTASQASRATFYILLSPSSFLLFLILPLPFPTDYVTSRQCRPPFLRPICKNFIYSILFLITLSDRICYKPAVPASIFTPMCKIFIFSVLFPIALSDRICYNMVCIYAITLERKNEN